MVQRTKNPQQLGMLSKNWRVKLAVTICKKVTLKKWSRPSKFSIRYKTSRCKWVLPRGRGNVVIQNQTTCTIFHHQEGWSPPPATQPPCLTAARPLFPTQKVYLHLTWEETGQINRSEGNKAKYVSSWYLPQYSTRGNRRKSCPFSDTVITIGLLILRISELVSDCLHYLEFPWNICHSFFSV